MPTPRILNERAATPSARPKARSREAAKYPSTSGKARLYAPYRPQTRDKPGKTRRTRAAVYSPAQDPYINGQTAPGLSFYVRNEARGAAKILEAALRVYAGGVNRAQYGQLFKSCCAWATMD